MAAVQEYKLVLAIVPERITKPIQNDNFSRNDRLYNHPAEAKHYDCKRKLVNFRNSRASLFQCTSLKLGASRQHAIRHGLRVRQTSPHT